MNPGFIESLGSYKIEESSEIRYEKIGDSLYRIVSCPNCQGSGWEPHAYSSGYGGVCDYCAGSGETLEEVNMEELGLEP